MSTNEMVNSFIYDSNFEWETVDAGVRRKIMAYDERVMMVKVDFETGAIGKLHHHYHTQISHVHSGSFEVEVAGEKQILNAGDVFFVPSNVIHGVVCLEAGMLLDVFSPMREDFIK
jgi:quercetin dioxygenase-like cupin family protein